MTKRLARLVLLLAIALYVGANAHARGDLVDLRRIDAVSGDAATGEANAAACIACHGADGVSPIPTYPNLAGQSIEFLYWSLLAIQREARADSPMTALVAGLTESGMRDLAAYFASMPRPPAQDAAPGAQGDRERGGLLYRQGDPARGMPPCQGCHGPNGEGLALAGSTPARRTWPALRAQPASYLEQKLAEHRTGGHRLTSNDHVMHGIARTLNDEAIRDIAAWLRVQP